MKRSKALFALLAVVALVMAACGSDDDPTVDGSGPKHNDADVEFAQGMIPHHQQAVEMSDMVLQRGSAAEVKDLATKIKAAQAPEIETMRDWLRSWDEKEEAQADHGGGHDSGTGMMSDDEMADLEKAPGPELDRMFLEMMIRHHEGAIEMARTELDEGQYADAKKLAQQIVDTQQAEIDTMQGLLARLR